MFDVVCLTLKKGEVRWESMCVSVYVCMCRERERDLAFAGNHLLIEY